SVSSRRRSCWTDLLGWSGHVLIGDQSAARRDGDARQHGHAGEFGEETGRGAGRLARIRRGRGGWGPPACRGGWGGGRGGGGRRKMGTNPAGAAGFLPAPAPAVPVSS